MYENKIGKGIQLLRNYISKARRDCESNYWLREIGPGIIDVFHERINEELPAEELMLPQPQGDYMEK